MALRAARLLVPSFLVLSSLSPARAEELDVRAPSQKTPGRFTYDEAPCGGDARGMAAFGIQTPAPPSAIAPPPIPACAADPGDLQCPVQVVQAGDVARLAALAARPSPKYDIVLQDGYYNADADALPDGYLQLAAGHRLWAAHAGMVVLGFGAAVGAPLDHETPQRFEGAAFRGLVFDIADPAHTLLSAALTNWGAARDLVVEDCWFHGWGALERGLSVTQPDGLRVARIEVLDVRRFGVFVDGPHDAVCEPGTCVAGFVRADLSDVVVHDVADPEWSSMCPHADCGTGDPIPEGAYCPGTQEHGIWIGAPAALRRARVRDVGWAGVLVGDVGGLSGVTLTDVDVDRAGSNSRTEGAGIAFERGNLGTVLRRFCVGTKTGRGVHAEWDHGEPWTRSQDLLVRDGFTRAHYVGVIFDSGVVDGHVENVRVENASIAALAFYQNNAAYLSCCTTTTWEAVDTSGAIGPDLTFSHYKNPEPLDQCPADCDEPGECDPPVIVASELGPSWGYSCDNPATCP
jgi:hypothetical protein